MHAPPETKHHSDGSHVLQIPIANAPLPPCLRASVVNVFAFSLATRFLRSLAAGCLLACLLAWSGLAGATDPVQVALRPEVTIVGEHATLGDVAELSGDEAAISQLSLLTILALPGLGEHLIDARTVRQALGRAATGRLVIRGACRVRRAVRTISSADLAAVAIAAVDPGGDEIQVAVVRPPAALAVPEDLTPPNLVATALDRASTGEIPFSVRALSGTRELGRSLVTLRIDRFRTVPVAARTIRRGETLTASDVVARKVAVRGNERYLDATLAVGQAARLDITAGAPFTALNLLAPRLVRGGSPVTVQVNRAGFQLASNGTALADGNAGDAIPVRRATDGQIITARITGPGEVTPAEQ